MELNTETIGRSPIFFPGKHVLLFVGHEVLIKWKETRRFYFFRTLHYH